jgi:uncharacterized repeat protein (TIGR03806 family)
MRANAAESGTAFEDLIMKASAVIFLLILFGLSSLRSIETGPERREKLSEYGFFQGKLSDLVPTDDVLFYDVNTPLFSNYAEKARFIRLPAGASAIYNDSSTFDLPVGTILIKNFYYPLDFRDVSKGRKILETRLLVRSEKGWEAWPYLWNDEQSEAVYDPAGETRTVEYVDSRGKKRSTLYAIPNKNQCKGCHISNGVMMPIGITARQLNRRVNLGDQTVSQLDQWVQRHHLSGLGSSQAAPRLAVWNDPSSGTLNERARAYLDANCGHCHSATGPANTSGLLLDIYESRPVHLGVNKTPVAAGRGAGSLKFDIVPGSPDQSILVFRMKTTDPAIAMPEIGREQIHSEGVALIEEWIRSHQFN